jgi:hypothetical protein
MASTIKSIPTLQGEDAERFLKEADYGTSFLDLMLVLIRACQSVFFFN